MIKKLVFVSILAASMCLNVSLATAQQSPLISEYEQVNPSDGGRYLIKRFLEKAQSGLWTVFPQKKANHYNKLIDHRFAELVYVYENKLENDVEKSAQRYFTTVGKATEYLEGKDWQAASQLISKLDQHEPTLEELISKSEYNSAAWLLLQQDLSYLRLYRSRL